MKDNYREADCCENCARCYVSFYPEYFCTIDGEKMPEEDIYSDDWHIWGQTHKVDSTHVCDDFEIIF